MFCLYRCFSNSRSYPTDFTRWAAAGMEASCWLILIWCLFVYSSSSGALWIHFTILILFSIMWKMIIKHTFLCVFRCTSSKCRMPNDKRTEFYCRHVGANECTMCVPLFLRIKSGVNSFVCLLCLHSFRIWFGLNFGFDMGLHRCGAT